MKKKITVVGLGYVGLPLARLFSEKYPVVGYDIDKHRVNKLKDGVDESLEVDNNLLQSVLIQKNPNINESGLFCSDNLEDIADANIYIITVPTPIDKNNRPLLAPLINASRTVGKVLKKDDIVIYESTVYPGATEEDCIPVLEKISGLTFNKDFFVGYSPERINPGDKKNTIEKVIKVTSGSTPEIGLLVNNLYKSVIIAGTHLAPSIKVAEAAKVIENSQRDINIAFVNELAKIFNLMDIDTNDVLEAAGTKWNFLKFTPGLVGGHCIGVDPYYLAQKAQEYGYHPEIILAGRRINDSMGKYVASQVVKMMLHKDIKIKNAKVLILGFTFKENCTDIRNTKVVDVVTDLKEYGLNICVYEPLVQPKEIKREYNVTSTISLPKEKFDTIILAVAHDQFKSLEVENLLTEDGIVYDVKNFLDRKITNGRL